VKPVKVHSAARTELAEAVAWYEQRCPGLGLDLLAEFQEAASRLRRHPGHCPQQKKTPIAGNGWSVFLS
jgi:hypothetical protein